MLMQRLGTHFLQSKAIQDSRSRDKAGSVGSVVSVCCSHLGIMVLASLHLVVVDRYAGYFCTACGGYGSHGTTHTTAHIQAFLSRLQVQDGCKPGFMRRFRGRPAFSRQLWGEMKTLTPTPLVDICVPEVQLCQSTDGVNTVFRTTSSFAGELNTCHQVVKGVHKLARFLPVYDALSRASTIRCRIVFELLFHAVRLNSST